MILVSCRIPWFSKAPKVILYLKVVMISWLKQLDDLSTMVVYVQLGKGLENKAKLTSKIHQELMEDMRKKTERMWLELR